jgi:hypothetical protein
MGLIPPAEQAHARQTLKGFAFKYVDGHRYVDSFIGTSKAWDTWLQPQVVDWVHVIKQLAGVAQIFPQTAYTGLAKSLQMEWQYL